MLSFDIKQTFKVNIFHKLNILYFFLETNGKIFCIFFFIRKYHVFLLTLEVLIKIVADDF